MVDSTDKVVLDAQLKHNKDRLNAFSKDSTVDENVRQALSSISMVARPDNEDVKITKIEQGKGEFKNHFDIEATTEKGVVNVSINKDEWKVKDTKNDLYEGEITDYKSLNKTFDSSVVDYEKLEKELNQPVRTAKPIENSIEEDIERTKDVAQKVTEIEKVDALKYGASVAVDNVTGLGSIKTPVDAVIAAHDSIDAVKTSVEVTKTLDKDKSDTSTTDKISGESEPVDPQKKQTQAIADKDQQKPEDEIPKTLLNKYHLVDHKFHYRNDPDKVAFEDSGKTLKTDTNDKEIAKSMVELAEAKKWESIKVKGTEEFKRTVWLEASLKGMQVKGYEPKDVDIAMLNELKKPEKEVKNSIEQVEDRQKEIPLKKDVPLTDKTVLEKPLTQTAEEVRQEKIQNLSEKERALLTIFERKMQAENFTEKQRDASMDQAINKLHDKQIHVGKLVDHGHAPYKNDPKNDPSYFATLENEKGQKNTLWAKDLERTLKEQNIIKNDDIVLTYKGANKVEVNTKEIDPRTGLPTGIRIPTVTNRGQWEAQSLSKLKESTEKALTKNHQTKPQAEKVAELKQSRSFTQPKIQSYSVNAPKQKLPVQPQKPKEREKNKDIPR